ncbi:RNA polymerase TFIIH complex subunit Ssl1 [Penicillium sp. DV-2018c]|nr:RNA polymerase TFIIH complex subunit Ssl1 [Penicillium sp. DV-2018c]
MADSDEEYVGEVTEDEDDLQVNRGDDPRAKKRKQRGGAEWELSRTWETLVEGADGTINSTVEGLLEAGKRKRLLKDTTPLQRGIIRHLILILDLSQSMSEKDMRPTRYLLTLRYAQEFVREFFEQNPISQLGVLGLRDGLALRVSDMSGNPTGHLAAIQALKTQEPKGLPSLQNGLEMARGALFHTPSHGTREVLILYGSLLSSDPGDIHQTIETLISDRIRVGMVGLGAQVAICRELCSKTNGADDGCDHAPGCLFTERVYKLVANDGVPFSHSGVQPLSLRVPFKAFTRRLSLFTVQQQSVQPSCRMPILWTHIDSIHSFGTIVSSSVSLDQLGGSAMASRLAKLQLFRLRSHFPVCAPGGAMASDREPDQGNEREQSLRVHRMP